MKKNQAISCLREPLLLITSICFFVIGLISCKNSDNEKKATDTSKTLQSEENASFTMNCVTLTRAQAQAWVDSGWTNPKSPRKIQTLLLQFYTADVNNAANNMQMMAYPGQNLTDVFINGRTILAPDTTCLAPLLSGPVIFGNNEINFADLKILNPDGTLIDFEYIRFTPAFKYQPYINFKVTVVKTSTARSVESADEDQETDPCPPKCPPPPPPVNER